MAKEEATGSNGNRKESAKTGKPKWTIMVYLAGDNNLSTNCIDIMQELEEANNNPALVRVLACFDSNTPMPKGARYLEINHRRKSPGHKPMKYWGLHNDLVPNKELDEPVVYSPDFCNEYPKPSIYRVKEPTAALGLSRFIRFALKKHKADRYMLILFGHGTAVASNTFLADNNPPSFLRLKEFAKVLRKHFGRKPKDAKDDRKEEKDNKEDVLDILACDNCVMNGIETAYEIRNEVDYMIGSQGLMPTVGWPFKKIIRVVNNGWDKPSNVIAKRIIKACARRLLDYSLMDRSTEQALCDLTKLRGDENLVTAVKRLGEKLKEGLQTDKCGKLVHEHICNAVKLARLEAQSYWDETFVDLYDFCVLLMKKCGVSYEYEFLLSEYVHEHMPKQPMISAAGGSVEKRLNDDLREKAAQLLKSNPKVNLMQEIGLRCIKVLKEVRQFVVSSYYIGPELQYSHGVSIYFPWTLPEDPIIFDPVYTRNGSGTLHVRRDPPTEFELKTAFHEYQEYEFAKPDDGDWACVLEKYFRATLRDVRRSEIEAELSEDDPLHLFHFRETEEEKFVPPVNLQKTSSDTDKETDCTCPKIKNYPRRFYLSPADCERILKPIGDEPMPVGDKCHVSYLGWNIRGLVAKVIGLQRPKKGRKPKTATNGGSKPSLKLSPRSRQPK